MSSSRRWVLSLAVTAVLGVVVALGPWSTISPLHSPHHGAPSLVAAAHDTRQSTAPSTAGGPVTAFRPAAAKVTTPVASPTGATSGVVATRVWVLLAAVALFAITMVLLGFAAGYRPRGRDGRGSRGGRRR